MREMNKDTERRQAVKLEVKAAFDASINLYNFAVKIKWF